METTNSVLILVLMEDTLRVLLNFVMMKVLRCLNPCSNGRYSQSSVWILRNKNLVGVLILVLMEDTLRVY